MSIREELAALIGKYLTDESNSHWTCDDSRIVLDGDFAPEALADAILGAGYSKQAPCVMTYTPPMDFAQCETHDETFPLGETCRFDGRDMVEVLFEAVDEQRGRAVRALMELEDSTPNVYVTTAEELDALPLDSVVVDRHGIPRTNRAGNSHMGGGWTNAGNSPMTSRELADGYLMRVAHNPKNAQ